MSVHINGKNKSTPSSIVYVLGTYKDILDCAILVDIKNSAVFFYNVPNNNSERVDINSIYTYTFALYIKKWNNFLYICNEKYMLFY